MCIRDRPVVSLEHRILLLEREGVGSVLVLDFDERIRSLAPEEFVRAVLVDGLGVGGLLMGFDSAFGNRRLGTFDYLEEKRDELGLEIRSAAAELLGDAAVSSTRVREAVANWNFSGLEKLLGHPFSIMGRVVKGDGRGRQLGFPTANLALPGVSVPPPGVYICDVLCLGGRPHARHSWPDLSGENRPDGFFRGVMNIGRRPTLTEGKEARKFDGKPYVLETALHADVSLVKAWKADEEGNLVYRMTARNFNPMMATAGRITLAEVEERQAEAAADEANVAEATGAAGELGFTCSAGCLRFKVTCENAEHDLRAMFRADEQIRPFRGISVQVEQLPLVRRTQGQSPTIRCDHAPPGYGLQPVQLANTLRRHRV